MQKIIYELTTAGDERVSWPGRHQEQVMNRTYRPELAFRSQN